MKYLILFLTITAINAEDITITDVFGVTLGKKYKDYPVGQTSARLRPPPKQFRKFKEYTIHFTPKTQKISMIEAKLNEKNIKKSWNEFKYICYLIEKKYNIKLKYDKQENKYMITKSYYGKRYVIKITLYKTIVIMNFIDKKTLNKIKAEEKQILDNKNTESEMNLI